MKLSERILCIFVSRCTVCLIPAVFPDLSGIMDQTAAEFFHVLHRITVLGQPVNVIVERSIGFHLRYDLLYILIVRDRGKELTRGIVLLPLIQFTRFLVDTLIADLLYVVLRIGIAADLLEGTFRRLIIFIHKCFQSFLIGLGFINLLQVRSGVFVITDL